jgi:phosphoribosylformylglycinamidine synthase
MKKILIFASGRGSNAESLVLDARKSAEYEVTAIVCDNPAAAVIEKAKSWRIPLILVPRAKGETQEAHEKNILEKISPLRFDLMVLAGYRRLLSSGFLAQFPPRSVINIHPSLLPAYPGLHSYERAFNDGAPKTGVSIHFVDEGMDTGEIIAQYSFLREATDTLESFEARGLALEHQYYPEQVRRLLKAEFIYRVEVYPRSLRYLKNKDEVRARVFKLRTRGPCAQLRAVAESVLIDSVVEKLFFHADDELMAHLQELQLCETDAVEVSFLPGVTDNTAAATAEALRQHPFLKQERIEVASGHLVFKKNKKATDLQARLYRDDANSWLERARIVFAADLPNPERFFTVQFPTVHLEPGPAREIELASDDEGLLRQSERHLWALNLQELHLIRDHFASQKRAPTDVEMEIIAQTWSEHCKHKIFAAHIDHEDEEGRREIKSLFKTFIQGATKRIERERKIDWLRSVFSDNAGIVRWDEKLDVCIKVETHNSPSALDPYGGALTGILGVNRDILGCGLGALPVANTDVFCLPPVEAETSDWPKELLTPEKLRQGVHRGVQDGGNKSGIPTINGAFYYDLSYAGKPLVYCGTVGVLPHEILGQPSHLKNQNVGDLVVMVGGRIGKDGIHGATFSSLELKEGTPSSVVQIGDPLTQKRVTDFLMAARDKGLYTSVTDNGAGGLSSSVGEMSQVTGGACIDVSLAPVKYPGLSPAELIISESQERMTCAVAPERWKEFSALAELYEVDATALGTFTADGLFTVKDGSQVVASLPLSFLFEDLPPMKLKARWNPNYSPKPWKKLAEKAPVHSFREKLRRVLSFPNVRSHEAWVRRYDHEVRAASVTKPFSPTGGPSDAGVIAMKPHGGGEKNAIAVSCGLAPQVSLQDTKLSAIYAVDEAVRNAVVVGADLQKMALVDNFCWPDPLPGPNNPEAEHKLAQLVRSNEGLFEAAVTFGLPLVSGKDSMKNDAVVEWQGTKTKISVLPTLLVTCLAHVPDVRKVLRPQLIAGHDLWILGDLQATTPFTLAQAQGQLAEAWKKPDLMALKKQYEVFHTAVLADLIGGAHDVSDGGVICAIIEMGFHSSLGIEVFKDDDKTLFAEGAGLIVLSASPEQREKLPQIFDKIEWIGRVLSQPVLKLSGEEILLSELKSDYQSEEWLS